MLELRYTLVADGSSDRALLPILDWLLSQYPSLGVAQATFADLRGLPRPPKPLAERIGIAVDLYPCDILFIHRDAEARPRQMRVGEIRKAVATAVRNRPGGLPPHVCVIPVRMQEAWLLFDERAIRRAAGNPNGTEPLDLPRLAAVEDLPDPKIILRDRLLRASGLGAHRQRKLDLAACARLVSAYTSDFSPLRQLAAFAALESDVATMAAGAPSGN